MRRQRAMAGQRYQAPEISGSGPPGRTGQAEMLRLPPMPAPTLASEGDPAPSRVSTEDFSASRFDFRTEVAICCWVLPACIEIKLIAKAATSIRVTPVGGDAIRQGLTNSGVGGSSGSEPASRRDSRRSRAGF